MLRTVNINSLNANITCSICGGYFVQATTIMECLHSFCKSCIVKYLETSYNCPVCQTEIHKTRPLLHVRPDPVLQDLVYKLVPSLYDDYHKAEQEFKKSMTTEETAQEESCEQDSDVKVPHVPDPIYVTLEQRQRDKNKNDQIKLFPIRYLRCPSSMPVRILKKFLRMKFFVKDSQEVEISRSDEVLFDYLTLKQVARIYGRYGKLAPLDLNFDVIPKNKVKDFAQPSLDWMQGIPAAIPSAVIPAVIPSAVIPAAIPSAVIPAVIPSDVIPTVIPSDVIPAVIPSDVIPAVIPSAVIPTVIPSDVIPAVIPTSFNETQNNENNISHTETDNRNETVAEDKMDVDSSFDTATGTDTSL